MIIIFAGCLINKNRMIIQLITHNALLTIYVNEKTISICLMDLCSIKSYRQTLKLIYQTKYEKFHKWFIPFRY